MYSYVHEGTVLCGSRNKDTNRAVTGRPTVIQEGTQTSTLMLINVTNAILLTQVTNIVSQGECNSVPV